LSNQQDTSSETSSNDFAVGEIVFEKYEILGFIASGGKGRVYRAKDQLRDLVVALKVLRQDSKNEKDMIRFQSEARTASRLQHPNIATIYDFGLSGATPYLSMEFIEGESLAEILHAETVLPLPFFFDVFKQVCDALEHAHKNGVVHRDLKPGNIAIHVGDDGAMVAKVLDFGVAKRIDALEDSEGRLTPTGNIVGSPLYMSPEQGRSAEITPAADVYSLGCMMWHCLAGEPPFIADTIMETIMMHQDTAPPEQLGDRQEEIPEQLTELIYAMLSKQPGERPGLEDKVRPLLNEFHEELLEREKRSLQEMELFDKQSDTVTDTKPTAIQGKFDKRLIVILAASVLILTGTVFLLSFSTPTKTTKVSMEHNPVMFTTSIPELESKRAATRDEGIQENGEASFRFNGTDEQIRDFKYKDKLRVLSVSASDVGDKSLEYLAGAPIEKIDGTEARFRTLQGLNKFKNLKIADFKTNRLDELALVNVSGLNELKTFAVTRCGLTDKSIAVLPLLPALEFFEVNQNDIKGTTLLHLIDAAPNLHNLHMARTPVTAANLDAFLKQSKTIRVVDLRDCKNISDSELKKLAEDYPLVEFFPRKSVLENHEKLAQKCEANGRNEAAIKQFTKCVEAVEKQKGKQDVMLIDYLFAIGRASVNKYRSDRKPDVNDLVVAERSYQRGSAIAKMHLLHLQEVAGADGIANVKASQKSFYEAERYYIDAQKLGEKYLKDDPLQVAKRSMNLALTYLQFKEFRKALQRYQHAQNIYAKELGPRSNDAAVCMVAVGNCYRALSNNVPALKEYNKALKILQQSGSKDREALNSELLANAGIAHIYMTEKKFDTALIYNDEAFRLGKTALADRVNYQVVLRQRIDLFTTMQKPITEYQAEIDEFNKLKNNRGNQ